MDANAEASGCGWSGNDMVHTNGATIFRVDLGGNDLATRIILVFKHQLTLMVVVLLGFLTIAMMMYCSRLISTRS